MDNSKEILKMIRKCGNDNEKIEIINSHYNELDDYYLCDAISYI